MAEPVTAIGVSSPTEPPKPTVIPLWRIWEYILVILTLLCFFEMSFSIKDISFSSSPLKKYLTINAVKVIPIKGKIP